MKIKRGLAFMAVTAILFLSAQYVFSQEQAAVGAVQNEPDTQWVWGEVASIDTQNQSLTVKYMDYETDQEKELSLNANEKTTYENIKSFNDIKVGNTAGIDYTTGAEGKNIARNISIESTERENAMPENAPAAVVNPP